MPSHAPVALGVLLCMNASLFTAQPHPPTRTPLPLAWRAELLSFREREQHREGPGGPVAETVWSEEEDALLLQHRHGNKTAVPYTKIAIGARSVDAIKRRHRKLTREVVAMLETQVWEAPAPLLPCISDAHAAFEKRLDATGIILPSHVRTGLVCMHADKLARVHEYPIEENACILAAQIEGKTPADVQISGRTQRAVRAQWLRLRQKVPGMLCRSHRAVCNAEAPLLQLQYDVWTPIVPELAVPVNAQINWLRGVARAPPAWELQLDASRFCFYDREYGKAIDVNKSDPFTLEDVRPDMSIGTLTGHVTRWLQRCGSPGASEIAPETVRLVVLAEPIAITPETQQYAVGDRVHYHRRDGLVQPATISAVRRPSARGTAPTQYTIALDDVPLTVRSETLTASGGGGHTPTPQSSLAFPPLVSRALLELYLSKY